MKRILFFIVLLIIGIGLSLFIKLQKEGNLVPHSYEERPVTSGDNRSSVQQAVVFGGVRFTSKPIKVENSKPLNASICIENPSTQTMDVRLPISIYSTNVFDDGRTADLHKLIYSHEYSLQIEPGKKHELDITIYEKLELPKDPRQRQIVAIYLGSSEKVEDSALIFLQEMESIIIAAKILKGPGSQDYVKPSKVSQ